MLRSKTLFVTAVLNLVSLWAAPFAMASVKDLENRVGVAQQSFTISGYSKTASCQVAFTDSAVIIGTRFNITPENENMDAIVNQIFVFDDKLTAKQLNGNSLVAERRYQTPERYCQDARDGGFYPGRSYETVQTLTIEGNKAEIVETYRCGLLLPTHKMINKTTCQF